MATGTSVTLREADRCVARATRTRQLSGTVFIIVWLLGSYHIAIQANKYIRFSPGGYSTALFLAPRVALRSCAKVGRSDSYATEFDLEADECQGRHPDVPKP